MISKIGTMLIGLILLINISNAHADLLPPSIKHDFGSPSAPDIRACFTLDGYKTLLSTQIDLLAALEREKSFQEQLDIDSGIIKLQEDKLGAKDLIIQDYKIDNKRLLDKWSEENRLRHIAENKPSYSWLGFALAGGFAFTTAVLATVIVLN